MKSYHDIAGDGGSRVLDQVVELQGRIAARLAGVRHRLAIASGKGGVGKSTVTHHLARAFRRQGLRVAILDADLNGPSQAHLAGLADRVPLPGPDGAVLPRTADGIGVFSTALLLEAGHDLTFDSVAPNESHTWRATRERTLLLDVLAGTAWGELDVLLVDLPPGAERTQQVAELLGPDAAFVLVTTPSDLARDVVARSARTLERMQARVLGQVENMSGYWCADCRAVKPLFARTGSLDLPLLGTVPFDPALGAGTLKAFDDVAASLWTRLEGR
jgi:ATP-binding protein involved in chromosome partitioning